MYWQSIDNVLQSDWAVALFIFLKGVYISLFFECRQFQSIYFFMPKVLFAKFFCAKLLMNFVLSIICGITVAQQHGLVSQHIQVSCGS